MLYMHVQREGKEINNKKIEFLLMNEYQMLLSLLLLFNNNANY